MESDNSNGNWVPLSPLISREVRTRLDPKQFSNLTLVLAARNIPFQSNHAKNPTDILVPAEYAAIACHEIKLYLTENRKSATKLPEAVKLSNNILPSLSVLALLGIFHNLTYFQISGFGLESIDWLQLGSADSSRIFAGEWWRIITALTLHTDGQHLLGNILIGGYFVVRLCQITGSGLGWLLILAAGAIGNLVNAIIHGAGHNAVGASTAIFGAIGIAGAVNSLLARQKIIRYWPLPLAAAGILLAFLGSGGENSQTDVGAHLFGFLTGIGLGIPAGMSLTKKGQPGIKKNILMAIAGLFIVLASWLVALLAGS